MTEEATQSIAFADLHNLVGMGLLGAVGHGIEGARAERLMMIERRILRIEMLLRRAGIEPESIPLREVAP